MGPRNVCRLCRPPNTAWSFRRGRSMKYPPSGQTCPVAMKRGSVITDGLPTFPRPRPARSDDGNHHASLQVPVRRRSRWFAVGVVAEPAVPWKMDKDQSEESTEQPNGAEAAEAMIELALNGFPGGGRCVSERHAATREC